MQPWGAPQAHYPQQSHHPAHPAHGGHQQPSPRVDFKFVFVKGGGAGILGKPGSVTPECLILDGAQLHYGHIVDTETRQRRIVLMLDHVDRIDPRIAGQIEDAALVLEIRSRAPRDVEIAIDRIASRYAAERAHQALAAQGRANEFRTVPCPHCGATVDLSTLAATPYVYCRFCSSLFQQGQPPTGTPSAYRTCDECGMFDRVQSYTEFYFYFLLIVYGFSMNQRHVCDACAGRLFWKTFLINFIFVLGVPSAIWIKLKSMKGRDPSFASLATANALAKKRRAQEARALYAELHQRYPSHPGLLFSEAQGHILAGDMQSGWGCLAAAMQSCSNYRPAQDLLHTLQQPDGGAGGSSRAA